MKYIKHAYRSLSYAVYKKALQDVTHGEYIIAIRCKDGKTRKQRVDYTDEAMRFLNVFPDTLYGELLDITNEQVCKDIEKAFQEKKGATNVN